MKYNSKKNLKLFFEFLSSLEKFEVDVNFYVDGKLKLTGTKLLSEDNAKHTFNIGAGIDFTGYQGYNFIGDISSCLVYDKSLTEKEVRKFNKGHISSGKQLLNWQN